jgi:hypothetical protein
MICKCSSKENVGNDGETKVSLEKCSVELGKPTLDNNDWETGRSNC